MSVNVKIKVLNFSNEEINVDSIKEALYEHYIDVLFTEGLFGYDYTLTLLKTPNFYTACLSDRRKSYVILDDPKTCEENLITLFKPYCKSKEAFYAENS